ncbi:hypothetical protein J6590_068656 [Homalodisca vitripennis]|nr:hypothetical protein J6590_068656 [Homalodisca vitripennis]
MKRESSSSEDELINLLSADDENLEDFINEIINDEEEAVGEFEFEEFNIVEVVGKGEFSYEVNHFTKTGPNTFIKKNDKVHKMDESDFVSKLPQPTHFLSPQGQNCDVKFSVDFSRYDIQ